MKIIKGLLGFIAIFSLWYLLMPQNVFSLDDTVPQSNKHINKQILSNPTSLGEGKTLNDLKRQLSEKEQQLDKLRTNLEQEKKEKQRSIDELNIQKKLLLDEQQALVEKLIEQKKRFSDFTKDGVKSSDRERFLAEELDRALKERAGVNKELAEAKEAKSTLDSLIIAHKNLKKELIEQQTQLTQIKGAKSELEKQLQTITDEKSHSQSEEKSFNVELTEKEARINQLQNELNQANQIVRTLQGEIETKKQLETKAADLEKQLAEARNLIMLKETELRILNESSNIIPGRIPLPATSQPQTQGSVVAPLQGRMANPFGYPQAPRQIPQRTIVPQNQTEPLTDVLVVTVIEDKVNLRSGPGNEHAPVMQVQRGSRLTVEARQGDWFRVVSPIGSRAFVHKDFVTTGQAPSNPPKPIARIGEQPEQNLAKTEPSNEANPEEAQRAFEALKKNFAKP